MEKPRSPRRLADVGAEAVLIAGGGCAILLQLANPAVGHAVARHSDFVADPLRRLRNTLTYVYAIVYGSPSQVEAVRRMVDRAHEGVRSDGSDPARGPAYDATDPVLQLWVVATLYQTAMTVQELLIAPLGEEDLDAIYADYAAIGTALQVPAEMWPPDRVAFGAYWARQIGLLTVDDTVRAVAGDLLSPPRAPLLLRAGMPLARLITAGLLPAELRAAYRMPWSPRRARRFERAVGVMAAVNRVLPRRVREWPKDRLLRNVR